MQPTSHQPDRNEPNLRVGLSVVALDERASEIELDHLLEGKPSFPDVGRVLGRIELKPHQLIVLTNIRPRDQASDAAASRRGKS